MARTRKEAEHFQVIDGKVVMKETDIGNLTEAENKKISFYAKTLGFEVVFIEEESKKKYYFTVKKAEAYLRKNDKNGLKKFKSFRKDADIITEEYKALKATEKAGGSNKPTAKEIEVAQKAMITAQKDAFLAQKKWFKEKYGQEEYDIVRKEY